MQLLRDVAVSSKAIVAGTAIATVEDDKAKLLGSELDMFLSSQNHSNFSHTSKIKRSSASKDQLSDPQ
jgi:hypothetical protein